MIDKNPIQTLLRQFPCRCVSESPEARGVKKNVLHSGTDHVYSAVDFCLAYISVES